MSQQSNAPEVSGLSSTPGDLGGTTDVNNMSRPYYGCGFVNAIKRFFKGYVKFSGRASRSEYWWAFLFTALVMLIPTVLFNVGLLQAAAWAEIGKAQTGVEPGIVNAPTFGLLVTGLILCAIVSLALLLPSLSVLWRRLQDANFHGAFVFLILVPYIGGLIMIVFALLPSKPEGRRFDR